MNIPVIFYNEKAAERAYRRRSALEQAAAIDPSLIENRWFESRYRAACKAWRAEFRAQDP